jgi:hypothetical protein
LQDEVYAALSGYNVFEVLESLILRSDSVTRSKADQSDFAVDKNKNGRNNDYAALMNQNSVSKAKNFTGIEKNKRALEILALEIMGASLQQEPKYIKNFLASPRQKLIKFPFFNFLLERMFFHQDSYIKGLYVEFMNNCLDTPSTPTYDALESPDQFNELNSSVVSIFLGIITEKYEAIFLNPGSFFAGANGPSNNENFDPSRAQVMNSQIG